MAMPSYQGDYGISKQSH